jgi:hypothetical protein
MMNVHYNVVLLLILFQLNIVRCENGCGPKGLNINSIEADFKDCCNNHDNCYGWSRFIFIFIYLKKFLYKIDTCGNKQFECDNVFYSCMIEKCIDKGLISRYICNGTAKFVDRIVRRLGLPFFKIAQIESCGFKGIFNN